jgi:hypothetical protein
MISWNRRRVGHSRSSWGINRPAEKYKWVLPLLLFAQLFFSVAARAGKSGADDSEKQTIQALLRRIDQLETRVAQLESGRQAPTIPTTAPAPTSAVVPPVPEPELPAEHSDTERMDPGKTLLKIRGFGDATLHGDNKRGDTTSFTLGQLDLFVTSDISEKFKFLGEIVFEAGKDNSFGVDLERYLLQYAPNDYFNLSVGRYHTAIGYYNTAYHHSTWLQTATARPFLFQFEDGGGILPIHNVGISATGLIRSGRLGLHYVAELGNGRSSHSPGAEPVQNNTDENNGKSFNLAMFVRPAWVRGLQAGFSIYHDELKPVGVPGVGETIFAAHGVIVRPNFEWLNEAMVIRHAPVGGMRTFETPGFYTQVSKRYGSYRPFVRYQYVNANNAEPIFTSLGLRHGPSVGLRFDASDSVALKLQYDFTAQRNQASTSGLAFQIGFTF